MLVVYFLLSSLWHDPCYFFFVSPFTIIFSGTKGMVNRLEEIDGTIVWRPPDSLKQGPGWYVRIAPRPEWLNAYSSHEIPFGCTALTKAGYPCKNFTDGPSDFCGTHWSMQARSRM